MKFSIGDPVSFINEKLEGKVLKELPGNCYRVEIEDGFTLDVLASEIVIRQSFLKQPVKTEAEKATAPLLLTVDADQVSEMFKELKSFHLLVIPQQSQLLGGKVQWWLMNGSIQDQLYAVTVPGFDKKENCIAYGLLTSGSSVLVNEFRRDDFSKKYPLQLRWITCNASPGITPVYHTRNFEPEEPALEQTNKKLPSPYCFTRYHLLEVNEPENLSSEDLGELYAKFKPAGDLQQKKTVQAQSNPKAARKDQEVFRQYGLAPSVNEMDLHIEELTHDPGTMMAGEMIDIQLRAFRKALDKALVARQQEITFIHGVGNGKLRSAIRRELSEQGFKFQDAPYEKYGSGATRVLLVS